MDQHLKLFSEMSKRMADCFQGIHQEIETKLKKIEKADKHKNDSHHQESHKQSKTKQEKTEKHKESKKVEPVKEQQPTLSRQQIAELKKNKPKSPGSSYFIFQRELRESIIKQRPEASNPEISKIAGKVWNDLNAESKKEFNEKFQEEKKAYEKKMKAFLKKYPRYSLIPKKEKKQKKKAEKESKKSQKDASEDSNSPSDRDSGSENSNESQL